MTFAHALRLRVPPFAARTLLLAGIAVLLAGCGGAQSRYMSHMERGRQYLAAGNLDKASIEFRNALQIQPKGADALYENGLIAQRRRNMGEALGFYQAAVDSNPGDSRARASLAKVFVLGG